MGFDPFGWAGDAIGWAGGAVGDALGVAGDAGEGLLEIGKSNYRATNFGDTSQYNPNRFEYGGRAGGADADASRYAGLAQQAQGRAGPQADYGQADRWAAASSDSRGAQLRTADMMWNRAAGNTPSIAGMQAQQDMRRAQAAQMSAAASARGAGGLALAQQQAANNVANAQGQISNQAQINAANERMQAEQAAFGAYTGLRSGDMGSQQQAAQQAQYNAGLQAQQRAQNDQYALGLYNAERGVRNDQLQAGVANQQLLGQSLGQQQTINSGVAAQRAGQEERNLQTGLGLGQDAMKMGIPAKAFGGPIMGGQPTLVGELGPEVITTSADGMVTPNHELTGLLRGRSFGGGAPAAASPSFAGASGLLGGSVGGEDKAHKDFAIRFARNPTGGGY